MKSNLLFVKSTNNIFFACGLIMLLSSSLCGQVNVWEDDYFKITCLPEHGVMQNSMYDKTTNDAFHKNDTIKGNIEMKYVYSIPQVNRIPDINAVWGKAFWEKTPSIELNNHMGDKPSHFPETLAKMQYDMDYVYVIFKVKDRYVKATEKKINGKVWLDSCVEFFFTPGPDTSRGYFNLEANCKGVFLLQYHLNNGTKSGFVDLDDCKKIEIAHSLSIDVEKEHDGPLEWNIEYRIPIAVLKKYMAVDDPRPGAKWRANFYKCADKTSHPHWLTWAPVDYPRPKFHLPEFFGWIEFE